MNATQNLTTNDLEIALIQLLSENDQLDELKDAHVETFEQACLLTNDSGVVLRLPGGQEFQITIVKTKG